MITFNEIEKEIAIIEIQKKYFNFGYRYWTQDEDGQIYVWKNLPNMDFDIDGWYPENENDISYVNVIEIQIPRPIDWKNSIIDMNKIFNTCNKG